ncbi:hypothetical protein TNCV_2740161 [Trichonephila clavipes]|nr:hypothetical protein TNCV_2740161 [Trichonephila clavipes]
MNMNRYTNTELADIYFIYDLSNRNGCVAVRLYRERYPTRRKPNHQMFTQLHQNLDLSEPRLTTHSSILKWTWWHEYPLVLLRSVKHPVFSNMSANPFRVGVVRAFMPMAEISNISLDALISYF